MKRRKYMTMRWNIFARELEDILASRGLRLGHLDDRAGIHREKVRRLRQSLLSAKSFPVLNPSEMEDVAETFQFKLYEILHLRAAVLAAAIEEQLMERINPESALLAADQILALLSKALRDNYGRTVAFDSIRGKQSDLEEETDRDKAIEGALLAIDRATKSLYLAMTAIAEPQLYNQQARTHFETALALLALTPDEVKAEEGWQVWQHEALRGLESVEQFGVLRNQQLA
jgi:hypothetical protein